MRPSDGISEANGRREDAQGTNSSKKDKRKKKKKKQALVAGGVRHGAPAAGADDGAAAGKKRKAPDEPNKPSESRSSLSSATTSPKSKKRKNCDKKAAKAAKKADLAAAEPGGEKQRAAGGKSKPGGKKHRAEGGGAAGGLTETAAGGGGGGAAAGGGGGGGGGAAAGGGGGGAAAAAAGGGQADRPRVRTSGGGGIWNPAVQPPAAVLRGATAPPGSAATTTTLSLELARQEAVRGLHSRLEGCCRSLRVRLVNKMFENWLLQPPQSSPPTKEGREASSPPDPVLGGAASSPAALQKELVEAGAPQAAAEKAAAELCRAAQAAARQLRGAAGGRLHQDKGAVKVEGVEVSGKKARQALIERKGNPTALRAKELCVPGSGARLRINEEHLDKLRALHGRHSGRPKGDDDFLRDVCCLLLRYSSLQGGSCHGGGMQSALTEDAFDVLHGRMGAAMECFASPLNCYWGRFCSAFPDTDCPFGSVGSFFTFRPSEGSFEANPPFEASVMRRMADHIHGLLDAATGPMSFVVVIPAWEKTEGWRALKESRFLRGAELRVPQKDHGFCEGSQHAQATRYRIATFDSSVFFLQNDAGHERWPPSTEVRDELLSAMVSKHCTVAQQMAAKQQERQQQQQKGLK